MLKKRFRRLICLLPLGVLAFLPAGLSPAVADDAPSSSKAEPEPPIGELDRSHWAFEPLTAPQPPEAGNAEWCRTSVDRFLLAKMEEKGLRPLAEADRYTLIRRVTYDLTGLPPTPEAIERFVNDDSPQAYEKLVDDLLSTRAYAERAAQYWLDLARFAETDGFEHDHVRPNAWRYRDWVISAFERDLPYPDFVRQQLAADLVPGGEEDALEFLIAGPDMPDINLQEERRHFVMNDLTATVGSVFFGLQMGCAACHHHKYDPISQHDFYRLRAYFEPLFEFKKNKRTIVNEHTPPATETVGYLMVRGDFRRPGQQLSPNVPRIDLLPTVSKQRYPSRVDLADFIGDPENPLSTRVIVNRIWQQHFGEGLCRTPSDVGLMGDWPEHTELIDWLAREFSKRGWSWKEMHRLIVTSSAYRIASRPEPGNDADEELWNADRERDPTNRYLSWFPRRRLEGEAIRDAMLSVSGELNRKSGGPGFRPPLPPEIVSTLLKNQWPVTKDPSEYDRRSIYLFVRRNLRYPLFDAFDKPDTNQSCPRRNVSTIAPQALILLNSGFSLEQAERLAARLRKQRLKDVDARIDACYRLCLGRPPSGDELTLARKFLSSAARDGDSDSAWTEFCLSMFNLNEFVYID